MDVVKADIIVVGCGFSGLAAARALRESGAQVVVLEGRARAGGRAYTLEVPGARLEMGAQWIGPGQPEIKRLAAEFGFEVLPRPSGGADKYCISLGDWAPTKVSSKPDYDLGEVADAIQRLDQLAQSQNLESPASDSQSRAFDAETIAGWCARELSPGAASLVGRISEGFLGLPEQVSFLHSLIYAQANGGFASLLGIGEVRHDSEVLPQGLGNLAKCAAESLGEMVRFNEPVTSIDYSDFDVKITTAANRRYAASAVIMAIPPAVAASIHFAPELPPKRLCIQRRYIPFSRLKFQVVFERAFWRDEGWSGNVSGAGFVTFDGSATEERGILVGFFGAREALDVWGLPKQERARLAIDRLKMIYGAKAGAALHYEDMFWLDERFSHGCVAAPGPGVWTNFGAALRQRCGRIVWAGSEVALSMTGQVEGAIQSGKSAAKQALEFVGGVQ